MSELLVFALAGRRWTADARGVRRIESPGDGAKAIRASVLGASPAGSRNLVVERSGEEHGLVVDEVIGLHRPERIHAMPALAARCLGTRSPRGLVELGGELIVVVDLQALMEEIAGIEGSSRDGE